MADDLTEYPTQRVRLQACTICGRQFNVESLKKHQAICRKVTNKRRKTFDAGKQRAQGSDVPYKATKRTTQIYTGSIRPQDELSKSRSKPNWREKHRQLIQAIREARTVTRAMKEGGPLPAFRPSEVPSDYVTCPYCRRNFNEHTAKRHIPFCQTQNERKQIHQPPKQNRQPDRGRNIPTQSSSANKQLSSNSGYYSNSNDVYNNGHKQTNSAPMLQRQNRSEMPPPPPPPPPQARKANGGWGGFRKLFGIGSKEEAPPADNYYAPEEYDDDYGSPPRRQGQPPVIMRTGRTHENTSLNVRARQKSDEVTQYNRRPPAYQPNQNGQGGYQYGNNQYNSVRPTAVGRGPAAPPASRAPPPASRVPPPRGPPASSGVQCYECDGVFNSTMRFCPHCGTRR